MAETDDAILRISKQLYSGVKVARLPQHEVEQVANYSNLLDINRSLRSIPVVDAVEEYKKLDTDIQEVLKSWDPEAAFLGEQPKTFTERYITPTLEAIGTYSSKLSEPYRALRTRINEKVSWEQAWRVAKDGNALFDNERERKADAYYDPAIAKIAKLAATGKTVGEIAAQIDTSNVKELEALDAYIDETNPDNQTIREAVADYDTAKISLGRDAFYNLFDVDPGEFGANRKGFNIFSGATDLAYQIAADPITWIPIAGQAYKLTQLSITGIAKQAAKAGTAKGVQAKAFAQGIESAFEHPLYGRGVTRFWDTVGVQIERYATGSATQKTEAFGVLTRRFGRDINVEAIEQLAKAKVFNAAGAKKFLQDHENATALIKGRSTRSVPVLPTYSVIRQARTAMLSSINKTLGIGTKKVAPGFDLQGEGLAKLFSGAKNILNDPTTLNQIDEAIKATSNVADKFVRNFEIAPDIRSLKTTRYTDKVTGKTIDTGLESTKAVVSLARIAGFSKFYADEIGKLWNVADEGQRFNIRDGLVIALGKAIGLTKTKSGADDFKKLEGFLKKEVYAATQKITYEEFKTLNPKMKKYIVDSIGPIKKGDEIVFNPATFADNSNKAVLEYQLSGQVSVPNVKEMMKLAYTNKNFFFRSMGSIFNGKVSEGIVNAWAFLTLVPRLGIRSVLEEIMMFGLVAPLKSIQFYIGSGFKTSAALRIIKNTHGGYFDPQGLGLFTRIYFQVLKRGATKDYIQRAKNAKSPEEIADLVAELAFSRRILPRTKNYERDAQYIKDWVQHGWGRRAWEDVTIGGSYGVRNEVLVQKAIGSPKEVARIHGDVAPFFADKDAANRKFGRKKEFEQINFQYEDDAYFYSLNNEIVRRVEFGGETAKIAIRYMENPSKAVEEIAKYLRRNKGIRDRFANAYGSKGVDTNKLANSIYWATREPFAARNGSISKGILNLVRKKDAKGKLVFNSDIDFNALTALKAEELPQTLLSQKYVPVVETDGGLIKNIVDKGYGWMDRQISMMAREPMFFANYRYFRQELDGFEKLRFNQLVEKGYDEKTAQELASKWAAEQATDLAGKRTLDFVDNPLVRTNLAFTLRNFARFYRATEDFYRRAYRATFKNPQSIVRLRLAADGLDHSGFIYNDDNGDKYFVFPGDQVINAVFSKVTWLLNRETPSEVMPLEFTGKVKFLTPSLDPESAIPTLSGPVSGVSILILRNLMPKHWAIRDRLTETTLGPRGKNVTYLDVIMPSNVKRFYNTFLDQNEIDSQWASAARKAATALEAQGDGLSIDATEEEKFAYQKRIEAIATNIIVSRFFLGLVSPVSPQIGIGADVPEYLKDLGNVNFKAEFNKLVGEIAATGNPDPYNEAVIRWDKLNPGLLAYKVSETDLDKLATVRKTKEAAQWLRKNKDLVDKYPEGSLFFVPNSGTFDFDEFEFLEQEGYIQYIPVKDFIMAVSVVDEKQAYYTLVNKWDEQIQGSNPAIQSVLRKQAAAEKEKFLNNKPLLKRELSTGQNRQLIEDAFEDLRRMIESGDAPQTSLTVKYREMIDTFDKADSMINMLVFDTADMRFKKDAIRNSTYERLQKIAQGDPQAEAIVRTIFKDLLGV